VYSIFLDIEATGLDPRKHKTIDLAFIIYDLLQKNERLRYQTLLNPGASSWKERDTASDHVHGYTYDILKSGKGEIEVKEEIIRVFSSLKIQRKNAVFICQNPSFDRAFFSQLVPTYEQEERLWPYHWLDLASMFWMKKQKEILKKKSPLLHLSKNEIARELGLTGEAHPHRAMQGVEHLMLCYKALF
jgi:oligoribonuclease